jgi:hypothetical protein
MATTITIQQVVDWARTYTRMVPIVGVGGFSNEPAITIANSVIQDILSGGINPRTGQAYAPFPWKFNRVSATPFDTVENTQEYTLTSVSNIGWLERVQIEEKNSTATPKPIYDIEVAQNLTKTHEKGTPRKVAVDRETSSDTIVRVSPVPGSEVWTVYVDYQAKPVKKTGLGDTWTPIPDELAFLYRQGFLAHALLHADDSRALREYDKFMLLMRKAYGLKDTETDNHGFYPERALLIG